ncbi:MAG: hypothetical protein ACI4IK_04720 [Eubacterium sp.]
MNVQSILTIAAVSVLFCAVCIYIARHRKKLFSCDGCNGDCSKCVKKRQ